MEAKKINYDTIFTEFLKTIDLDNKPTLFLHACCAPCLTYPLSILSRYFKVTVGYINHNIYPLSEFDKRQNEVIRFIKEYSRDNDLHIDFVSVPNDYKIFLEEVKGHELDKEGGDRCEICHRLRMRLAYEYASKNNFDYFTTVMTVSSKKPSRMLNEIGLELQKTYTNTKFIVADFKKRDGQLKGINIGKQYNLYRQDYCGCSFSLLARQEYLKRKAEEQENN